jgi:DNA invertase Pin-like site-specific DNA recombinase
MVIEPFRVGYVRCSTDEQDIEIQTDQLIDLSVPRERIFIDKGFSGTTRRNRTGLDNALTAVTSAAAAGNGRQVVLTTTKFDRFARNMAEAGDILTGLRERDVLFGLGSQIYDWADPFGKLFLQTLAMVAEFEANLGQLRTREGMAKARAKGRLKGKQPKLPLTARKTIHRRYHDPMTTRAWLTSPRNTASAAPPSTESSAAPRHECSFTQTVPGPQSPASQGITPGFSQCHGAHNLCQITTPGTGKHHRCWSSHCRCFPRDYYRNPYTLAKRCEERATVK